MKTLKKYILLAIPCIIMSLMVHNTMAQDRIAALKETTPEQRANLQTTMMKNKLQLDSAQTKKVKDINLKYAQKLTPVLNGDEGKFKRMREIMSIQKAKDADLKTVFTKDQEKQYEAMKDEMKEKLKDFKKEKQ